MLALLLLPLISHALICSRYGCNKEPFYQPLDGDECVRRVLNDETKAYDYFLQQCGKDQACETVSVSSSKCVDSV
jgi:hypothetical protein